MLVFVSVHLAQVKTTCSRNLCFLDHNITTVHFQKSHLIARLEICDMFFLFAAIIAKLWSFEEVNFGQFSTHGDHKLMRTMCAANFLPPT